MYHFVGIYQKFSSYASEIQSQWSIIIVIVFGGGGGGAAEISITTTTITALQPSFSHYLTEIQPF